MSWTAATLYGLLQGVTEFLPVSSSAHLLLAPWATGVEDPGLTFSVALHLGTLAAVLAYFWRDWLELARGALARPAGPQARLLGCLVLATLPAAAAGLLLEEQAETAFREPARVAAALILFGLLMGWADRARRGGLAEGDLGAREALAIGLAQALAIVPGVSRSGVTLTAGLALGMSRPAAARFSFLLSTPVIGGAALLRLRDLAPSDLSGPFAWSVAVAALSGYAAVGVFLAWVGRAGLAPFVVYRIALGGLILAASAAGLR